MPIQIFLKTVVYRTKFWPSWLDQNRQHSLYACFAIRLKNKKAYTFLHLSLGRLYQAQPPTSIAFFCVLTNTYEDNFRLC